MDFKCPLCEAYFLTQDLLREHVKDVHTTYYYDTFLAVPLVLNELSTIGTTATVVTTAPVPGGTEANLEMDEDGCCCGLCPCLDGCCGDGDGCCCGLCDCGDCSCGLCDCDCSCSIM
ncbi:chorion class high-cysteine HCA protein 12-like [Anopheles albimanus]|uniref:chorion class high-cysteine HCA protein 12-like n=1 Tax=Anopheles albimanus TaxID=7167 RepID=UPI00163E7475|nr:chorion class high-cysteine HCA protein 12-like [Anopheles albimanus]